MAIRRLLPSILGCAATAAAYTWPNPLIDAAEAVLYEHSGSLGSSSPAFGVVDCSKIPSDKSPFRGRTSSAEWLRVAYHDMATADVGAGTGGIDASIVFADELTRGENIGMAFSETFSFLNPFQSSRVSMADLIAMGARFAVASCSNGSLIIPLRAGRIDALEAGPAGVPQPQEDLASHTASFVKQGFNTTEMIGLVACGHTLGGVHGNNFPEIVDVTKDTATDTNRQDFDGSVAKFDNNVAVQFVQNSTQNPLAFGHNETTRSDFRIFNADGGEYIRSMAEDPAFFNVQCSSLLERMIHTVPSTVQLSEVIEPIYVKPRKIELTVKPDGTMNISGQIRVMRYSTSIDTRNVTLVFTSRDGSTTFNAKATKMTASWTPAWPNSPTFNMYEFNMTIPVATGISSFIAQVEEQRGVVVVADNGGGGFPVSDAMAVQVTQSCTDINSQFIIGSPNKLNLTVAARDDLQLSELNLSVDWPLPNNNNFKSTFETRVTPLVKGVSLDGTGYSLWTGVFSELRNSWAGHQTQVFYSLNGLGLDGPIGVDSQVWQFLKAC